MWKDFHRKPKKINNENYICVLKGLEKFKVVSPIFRKNIYVGAFPGVKSETLIDFFRFDANKYVHLK